MAESCWRTAGGDRVASRSGSLSVRGISNRSTWSRHGRVAVSTLDGCHAQETRCGLWAYRHRQLFYPCPPCPAAVQEVRQIANEGQRNRGYAPPEHRTQSLTPAKPFASTASHCLRNRPRARLIPDFANTPKCAMAVAAMAAQIQPYSPTPQMCTNSRSPAGWTRKSGIRKTD